MKRDDTLWKGILEDLFDDFLRFFVKNAVKKFDFKRGFEFLDKELEELFPLQEGKNVRFVDKLVKVWLKNGQEEWILIHIEVQGQAQQNFAERMFVYYYRILDRYNKSTASFAIYSDNNPTFHPKSYSRKFLNTSINFKFNTYKIIDQNEESLVQNPNPFAVIILTVLTALKKGKVEDKRLIDLKIDLVKNLMRRKFSHEKIEALMSFITRYVRFSNSKYDSIFEEKLDFITEKNYPMGIKQLILTKERAEGKAEGRAEGRAEGKAEGRAETQLEKDTIFTQNLLLKTDFSEEKIASLVGVKLSFVFDVKRRLNT